MQTGSLLYFAACTWSCSALDFLRRKSLPFRRCYTRCLTESSSPAEPLPRPASWSELVCRASPKATNRSSVSLLLASSTLPPFTNPLLNIHPHHLAPPGVAAPWRPKFPPLSSPTFIHAFAVRTSTHPDPADLTDLHILSLRYVPKNA